MMQNVSPRTPPLTLGSVSDVYEIGFPSFSIPLSPVSPDSSPWDMPNTVTQSPEPELAIPFNEHQRGPMEIKLEPCINFYMSKPDEIGIPLKDALHGRFARLVERDEPMFKDRGPTIVISISDVIRKPLQWPGYNPWSRQIPIRDFRSPPGPITRSKLAKNVARCVRRFIVEHRGRPMEEDGESIWALGARKIEINDLVLVRLDHVSKNSWQAQLQLLRPPDRT
ncbi:hypothetical protein BGY98DRAFT_988754 [Russula aff. rugulosa BPL654]|nr:hypothetical protein BGY98DRAFT_988754 [Russula aff. rugulosa BPL654]